MEYERSKNYRGISTNGRTAGDIGKTIKKSQKRGQGK
jgi:hypothetical protein